MRHCGKCGSAGADNAHSCARCGSPLDDRTGGQEKGGPRLLLSTFNPSDVAFVKSLLESAGIAYYIEGEEFALVRPLAVPARIMVSGPDYDDAREILKDFKGRITGLAISDEK